MKYKRFKKKIKKFFQKIRRKTVYYLFLSLKFFVLLIPVNVGLRLGSFLGRLTFYVHKKERKRTLKNLRKVFKDKKSEKELKKIGENVFRNIGLFIGEVLYAYKSGDSFLKDNIEIEGKEYIDKALSKGKGFIGLTAHLGNWELLAAYLSRVVGIKVTVIARELSNPDLENFAEKIRSSFGVKVLIKGSYLKEIIRILNSNEGIGILADHDTKGKGIFVDFLGFPAYTQVGIALLKLKMDTEILPMFIRREDFAKNKITILEPLRFELTGDNEKDIYHITRECNRVIENQIFQYPDQWMWMHKRWKTKKKDVE